MIFYWVQLSSALLTPIIAIRDETLNRVVWDAVVTAILDPDLIATQVEKLQHERQQEKPPGETEQKEIDAGLKQLQNEEARLLEAYRLEIISAAQLNQELEKLNPRKTPLLDRQAKLAVNLARPPLPVVQRSIREYCELAAANIRSLNFEQRQEFLRTLIKAIVFEGKSVRIRGLIPISSRPDKPAVPESPSSSGHGRIETTAIVYCENRWLQFPKPF